MSGSVAEDERFRRALSRVGRVPRIVLFVVAVIFVPAAWAGGQSGLPPLAQILVAGVPVVSFLLSLRIKAYVTADAFVVRSYFRTRRFDFARVLAFDDAPYSGFWTRYDSVPDNWLGLGARMIEVSFSLNSTTGLPATLCGRATSVPIAEGMNRLMAAADSSRANL